MPGEHTGVHDAQPMDVYADAQGKLWRVVGVCGEPTVIVEEIEPKAPDSPVRRSGGVSGYMWHGFRRIFRPEPKINHTTPFAMNRNSGSL